LIPFWVPNGTTPSVVPNGTDEGSKIKFQKGTSVKVAIFAIYKPIFMKLVALDRYYQAE